MRIAFCRTHLPIKVIAFGDTIDIPMAHTDEATGLLHDDIGVLEVNESVESILVDFSSENAIKYLESKYGAIFT